MAGVAARRLAGGFWRASFTVMPDDNAHATLAGAALPSRPPVNSVWRLHWCVSVSSLEAAAGATCRIPGPPVRQS